MGLTTFWPLTEKPKIGHLRDDAYRDFSNTFGLLQFKLRIPLGPEAKSPENGHTHTSERSTQRGVRAAGDGEPAGNGGEDRPRGAHKGDEKAEGAGQGIDET